VTNLKLDRMKTPLTFLLSLTFLFLFSGCGGEVKREFYESGKLLSETPYKNGKAEGLATSWYETGEKMEETLYKNGQREGLETHWYKTGEKHNEYPYKNGRIIGLATYWHKNGVKSREEQWKDDNLWLVTTWGEDGKMTSQFDHEGDPRA
jgi:antitoxin component YwqK of YwqJK toxin-antitoxin module